MGKYFLPDNTYTYGFRFKQKYPNKEPWISLGLAGKPHLGDDLICNGIQGIATLNGWGELKGSATSQGGWQLYFYPEGTNDLLRFLHLKKESIKTGPIKVGDKVFITSNSGSATTTPHLHNDIWDLNKGPLNVNDINGFKNPADYDWNMIKYSISHNIILGGVPNGVLNEYLQGLNKAVVWFSTTTNGELTQLITLKVSQAHFTSTPAIGTDGSSGWRVYWEQIAGETIPEFKYATLMYDPFVVTPGIPQTNFANQNVLNGRQLHQVVCPFVAVNPDIFAEALVHEWLHGFYSVLNSKGLNLVDDVHQYSSLNDNAGKSYKDLLIKLKPYWPQLATAVIGEPMLIIHKQSDPGTKYALSSDAKIGFADFPAYQKFTLGRVVVDLELADAEFNKIPTSQAVIKT